MTSVQLSRLRSSYSKMAAKGNFVDFYKVLQCDRNTSFEDLKKNYQKLILSLHPDKIGNEDKGVFHLVQKAWSVLKDPESRKLYDAELMCQDHSDFLLYDTISLSDMEYSSNGNFYTYCCRCGGTYLLDSSEAIGNKVIIGCDECSFSVQVNL